LEVLRKLRTEKTAEIKQLKLQLDHLKTHKVAAADWLLSQHWSKLESASWQRSDAARCN
jgi:hypothetical protein